MAMNSSESQPVPYAGEQIEITTSHINKNEGFNTAHADTSQTTDITLVDNVTYTQSMDDINIIDRGSAVTITGAADSALYAKPNKMVNMNQPSDIPVIDNEIYPLSAKVCNGSQPTDIDFPIYANPNKTARNSKPTDITMIDNILYTK